MKRNQVRIMTEMGMAVALSAIFNFLPLWKMPQGGSISLEMLPILIIALRWGVSPGMLAGGLYGLLQLVLGAYIVHPIQLVLDYPLPYALLGLAGLFVNKINLEKKTAAYSWLLGAILIGGIARFISHFLSGAVFFAQYAPEGQNPWLYSAIYNLTYIIPALFLCYLIIMPLLKHLIIAEGKKE